MKNSYYSPKDQKMYKALIKKGLTDIEASNILALMGAEKVIHDDFMYHYDPTFFSKKEPRKALPYYYGKRRY